MSSREHTVFYDRHGHSRPVCVYPRVSTQCEQCKNHHMIYRVRHLDDGDQVTLSWWSTEGQVGERGFTSRLPAFSTDQANVLISALVPERYHELVAAA